MRAIHLVGPDTGTGVQPLCGDWGSMDTDWTTVEREVTCAGCTTGIRRLASDASAARNDGSRAA